MGGRRGTGVGRRAHDEVGEQKEGKGVGFGKRFVLRAESKEVRSQGQSRQRRRLGG